MQLILENIMDAYFYKQKIDISREVITGDGKVDFKLYRSDPVDEKLLIEVKMAKTADLRKGYEKQLTEYMHSSQYDNAFYLVACYTDEEIEKVEKFRQENICTDMFQMYINISILDLRKRKPVSA